MAANAPALPDIDRQMRKEIDEAARCKCDYGEGRSCPMPCENEMDGEDRLCGICRLLLEKRTVRGLGGHCHLFMQVRRKE